MHLIAAAADTPYIVVALCGAVSALFLALGKLATLLLSRTDKANAEIVAELRGEIVLLRAERDAERTMNLKLLGVTEEAVRKAVP